MIMTNSITRYVWTAMVAHAYRLLTTSCTSYHCVFEHRGVGVFRYTYYSSIPQAIAHVQTSTPRFHMSRRLISGRQAGLNCLSGQCMSRCGPGDYHGLVQNPSSADIQIRHLKILSVVANAIHVAKQSRYKKTLFEGSHEASIFFLRFVRYSSSCTILSWLVILGAGGGARVNHRIGWYSTRESPRILSAP
ncbi:hypothetical protein P692DRAFT_20373193 [Suillus brevipes Sb2]|nr:hypothetical protein P692DRAFT_20373193 [Suillus brevipes Sb2]